MKKLFLRSLLFTITLISVFLVSTQAVVARDMESKRMFCIKGSVKKGDSMYKVKSACGEPIDKTRSEITVTTSTHGTTYQRSRRRQNFSANSDSSVMYVDKWTYDVGGGVIHELSFEGGTLKSIHYFRK